MICVSDSVRDRTGETHEIWAGSLFSVVMSEAASGHARDVEQVCGTDRAGRFGQSGRGSLKWFVRLRALCFLDRAKACLVLRGNSNRNLAEASVGGDHLTGPRRVIVGDWARAWARCVGLVSGLVWNCSHEKTWRI